MRLTISELAKATGLTARTLRFYGEVGLVIPAGATASGMRYYGPDEVLRLQRVLVYRKLQVPLEQIGRILADEIDAVTALRQQRDTLLREQQQLTQVISSVERALRSFTTEGEPIMTAENTRGLFDGFDTSAIEADAQKRWPEQANQSRSAIDGMSDAEKQTAADANDQRLQKLGVLLGHGASAADARVQAVVGEMHEAMTSMWTPDRNAFTMVGHELATQADSRTMLERIAPELPKFIEDAYAEFASVRLA